MGRSRDVAHQPFRPFHDLAERNIPHREKDHIVRRIETAHERPAAFRTEGRQAFLIAQDIMPQGMTLKQQILEVVEDQLRRTVFIRTDLIPDHIRLFGNLHLRKRRMKYQIDQQVEGTLEMLAHEERIDKRLFLRCIGIQFATHRLHPVQDIVRTMALGTFKNHVFHEMRQSVFRRLLVAGPGIDGKSAIRHRRFGWQMHHPQSVGQGMCCIFHKSRFLFPAQR